MTMIIDKLYIDGAFVAPCRASAEVQDLFNPATGQVIGRVTLGDAEDARRAIAAAKRAFPAFSRTTKAERLVLLHRLHDVVKARADALVAATVEEYGGPVKQVSWRTALTADSFLHAAKVLQDYEFTKQVGTAEVVMEPLGVVGIITPWNANTGFICGKLATAIAAPRCTRRDQAERDERDPDPGAGRMPARGRRAARRVQHRQRPRRRGWGGAERPPRHRQDLLFTGSTAVGKAILRAGAETLKRVTLELGGKSPTVVLDDADFAQAVPLAIGAGFINSGQACIAGTRILVPETRMAEFCALAKAAVAATKVGDPRDPETAVGPMVSARQWERVQRYIRIGQEEGAELLAGGEGRPEGLEGGWFVRPTLFGGVTNDMTIAREEIFGPVLSILSYRTEAEAIAIANDTTYGLQAYVLSSGSCSAAAGGGGAAPGRPGADQRRPA